LQKIELAVAVSPAAASHPAVAPVFSSKPEVPDTPFTRPEVLARCLSLVTEPKCRCYTVSGTPLSLSDALCRKAVVENINFADLQL
jgi:hypothetical protein